jgi:phage tail sheath protein FI
MPSDKQSAQNAVAYRKQELNINSSYGAIYTPDLKILDTVTDRQRFIPPSGHVAASFARTDRDRATWFSPAGIERGQVKNVRGLRVRYSQGDRDLMHDDQVNFIINKPGKGIVIWSAETLQARASALSNVNVRRLLIVVEVSLANALDYSVHDPNDPFTRFLVKQAIDNFLQPIKEARGLYEFFTVCDESNNKNTDIDSYQLNVDVYLKPVLPAKFIRLQTIITNTGANITELIQTYNGNF